MHMYLTSKVTRSEEGRRVLRVRSSNLVRWGGIAAALAGLIFIVLLVLTNPQQGLAPDTVFSGSPSMVLFLGALLGQMVGVAGLHALQRGHYGRLGTVGSLVAFAGFALEFIAFIALSLLGGPSSAVNVVLALLLLLGILAPFVGLVLLGVATLRARVLPRWFGVLLIVGMFVVALLVEAQLVVVGLVAYGVFWILVGYELLSSGRTEIQHPTRAR